MPEPDGDAGRHARSLPGKLDKICKQVERATGWCSGHPAQRRTTGRQSPAVRPGGGGAQGRRPLARAARAARIDFQLDLPDAGQMAKGDANQRPGQVSSPDHPRAARHRGRTLPSRATAIGAAANSPPAGCIAAAGLAGGRAGMELAVGDDGPGIADTVMPRLFEPFFTAKPTGKGTGLGLSINHGIIKRMGGRIAAENRPEGGARFGFLLHHPDQPHSHHVIHLQALTAMSRPADRDGPRGGAPLGSFRWRKVVDQSRPAHRCESKLIAPGRRRDRSGGRGFYRSRRHQIGQDGAEVQRAACPSSSCRP